MAEDWSGKYSDDESDCLQEQMRSSVKKMSFSTPGLKGHDLNMQVQRLEASGPRSPGRLTSSTWFYLPHVANIEELSLLEIG